jgi:hypothetical protein
VIAVVDCDRITRSVVEDVMRECERTGAHKSGSR